MVLYTIGHSIHPIEIFLSLLRQHDIGILIDVRSFPASRRWPHFNHDELKASVEESGMSYRWCKALGGRRHSPPHDSPHRAWRQGAFRSYADYADTAEFSAAIESLHALAAERRCASMCAEGLWWRCHRRIIADHLAARGWDVRHIMPNGKFAAHSLPDFARVDGRRIIYDRDAE
jgi:uncharacterized protein (DUF488 family)